MLEFLIVAMCLHDYECGTMKKAYFASKPEFKRSIKEARLKVRRMTPDEVFYLGTFGYTLYKKEFQIRISKKYNLDFKEDSVILGYRYTF